MEGLDHYIFEYINQVATNDVLDSIMPFMREKRNWIPLYLLLTVLLFVKYHFKKASIILLLAIATIGISDTVSSKIIKPTVQRARPCHENALPQPPRLLVKACGGGYSFTSSHATNHFALAVFLGWVFARLWKPSKALFLAWAACISYAQVYVGLHFPLDVISGGIIGAAIGYGMYRLCIYITEKALSSTLPPTTP